MKALVKQKTDLFSSYTAPCTSVVKVQNLFCIIDPSEPKTPTETGEEEIDYN